MLRKFVILVALLALLLAAACGNDDGADSDPSGETSTGSAGVTLNEDYANALPVPSQLAIGTLMLDGTDNAVTVEQAGKLLPPWKMLQALQSSGTAAQAELDAVLDQIQGTMTKEQLSAIKEMELTLDSMSELAQERGLGFGRGFGGDGEGAGGFRPPAGVLPPGGGGREAGGGAFIFGGGFGAGENLNSEEQQAAIAQRMNTFLGSAMNNMVISLLEARAEGESWEVAAPNQDFVLQRSLFETIVEATGLDQQEIMTQVRDGKTLLEIAEANGADVDEIVAQVVAAETERVNQAVADGSTEHGDADQWLADLQTRARDLLEQPFGLGGRGAPGGGSTEP